MKNFKTTCFVLLLMIISLCFGGCATINLGTITNTDGSIDEIVSVVLDVDAVIEAGENPTLVKNKIQQKGLENATKIYDKFILDIQVDINFSLDEQRIAVLKKYRDGLKIIGNVWQDDIYKIGIRFPSEYAYNYFYNIQDTASTPKLTEHFFYTKVEYDGLSKFCRYGNLQTELTYEFNNEFKNLANVEPVLTYTLETELRRQHSNADLIQKINNKYYHTWIIEQNDEVLTLYYNVAKPTSFMIVSFVITLSLCVVLLIVAIIIKANKKHNKNKI